MKRIDTLKPEDILRDTSASNWLKKALTDALKLDPVDAANEAFVLYHVLNNHCKTVFKTVSHAKPKGE